MMMMCSAVHCCAALSWAGLDCVQICRCGSDTNKNARKLIIIFKRSTTTTRKTLIFPQSGAPNKAHRNANQNINHIFLCKRNWLNLVELHCCTIRQIIIKSITETELVLVFGHRDLSIVIHILWFFSSNMKKTHSSIQTKNKLIAEKSRQWMNAANQWSIH